MLTLLELVRQTTIITQYLPLPHWPWQCIISRTSPPGYATHSRHGGLIYVITRSTKFALHYFSLFGHNWKHVYNLNMTVLLRMGLHLWLNGEREKYVCLEKLNIDHCYARERKLTNQQSKACRYANNGKPVLVVGARNQIVATPQKRLVLRPPSSGPVSGHRFFSCCPLRVPASHWLFFFSPTGLPVFEM